MSRKFSSYGPILTTSHYYVPRTRLIDKAYEQLVGEKIDDGGHFHTVWAPRQCGKSWTLIQVLMRLKKDERFFVAKINMEAVKGMPELTTIYKYLVSSLNRMLKLNLLIPKTREEFLNIFLNTNFSKPIILILDEFDALDEHIINDLVSILRDIYQKRRDEVDKTTFEKEYMLHGVALIGVRSVLGIENIKGSPFNVQRSVHIPNLTFDEVKEMFDWYMRESGQKIEPVVVEKLYYETKGQPGLVSWFGELLTETYNVQKNSPITMKEWDYCYVFATQALPNNTVLNLLSKAQHPDYKNFVLSLFDTVKKQLFRFDHKATNYLYLNGVVDYEKVYETETIFNLYTRFPCPFIQKRLFNYFSDELFNYTGKLIDPFDELKDVIYDDSINFRNLMKRYEVYLQKNSSWLFKDVPRRSDLRIYEAVFHFNLYRYLSNLFEGYKISIHPEFPTGNGKIDLLITYKNNEIGLELKSFTNRAKYNNALEQAAQYGKSLGLKEINLLFFIESIDDKNRQQLEVDVVDKETGVKVIAVFAQIGNTSLN